MKKKALIGILIILVSAAIAINIIISANPAVKDFDVREFAANAIEKATPNLSNIQFSISKPKPVSDNSDSEETGSDSPISITLNQTIQNTSVASLPAPTIASQECLNKYNITSKTIIFYNADELHSNNMKPIINELPEYSFYWENTTSDSEFNACFGYYTSIPTFVCPGSGAQSIGEISKSALEQFAEDCV